MTGFDRELERLRGVQAVRRPVGRIMYVWVEMTENREREGL